MNRRSADLLLLAAAAVWGATFVVTKTALSEYSPGMFLLARFGVGALCLVPLLRRTSREAWKAGILLGVVMAGGFLAQTVGLAHTTPSRSAFITGLSSVLVPFVGWIWLRHRLRATTILGVVLAGLGLLLLTNPNAGGLNRGDAITLICALLFGIQIVAVARYGARYALLPLVTMEVVVTGGASALYATCCEAPAWSLSGSAIAAVLFAGVAATAAALWAQLEAQRHMSPTRAGLILALEPVFASITAWVWLGETLTALQLSGGALILAGMVVADWPDHKAAPVASTGSRRVDSQHGPN